MHRILIENKNPHAGGKSVGEEFSIERWLS